MSADLARLGRLMLALEMAAQRAGWQQTPAAWMLHDASQIATDQYLHGSGWSGLVRQESYAARRMFPLDLQEGMPSWELFRDLALKLAFVPDGVSQERDILIDVLRRPGLIGFAVVIEGWFNLSTRVAQAKSSPAEANPGKSPWSRECRSVFVVDMDWRVHAVRRLRGERPVLEISAPIRGDFTTSLRIIVDGVKGRPAPESQEAFALRYPSADDLPPTVWPLISPHAT